MDKNKLEQAIINSKTIKEAIEKLGLRSAGGNYSTFRKYVTLWNLDISHFDAKTIIRLNLEEYRKNNEINMKDILSENCDYNRRSLKRRLYCSKLKQPICELCGQDELWNGRKMSLILDHINGIHNDNRLENLQIICPNCNATLDTFAGKNTKKRIEKAKKKLSKTVYIPKTRIVWPSKEELEIRIWNEPTTKIAKELGISDSAVTKHCKKLGINKPPRGYWEKIYHKDWSV